MKDHKKYKAFWRLRPVRFIPEATEIIIDTALSRGVNIRHMIASTKKTQAIAMAREEACARIREELGLSYPQIAKQIGFRDHTSALLAVRRFIEKQTGRSVS